MRKLYALLAGFFLILVTTTTNARPVTPDVANFTFSIDAPGINVSFTNSSTFGNEPGIRRSFWSFGDGNGETTGPLQGTQHHYQASGTYTVCLKIYRYGSNANDSVLSAQVCKTVTIETTCRAGFETIASTATPLGKYFVAQPWHSTNRKPVRICWTFGDGKDTCIQYPIPFTGAYAVYHLYTHADNYNVCVNILYDGGCEAHSCHAVQAGETDSCRANFEKIPVSPTSNPLQAIFNALPWHNNNKKPVRICWTFGDGRDTCIQYAATFPGPYTVNHLYANSGSYHVCVDILYQGGCEATKCESIQVARPDTCHADFERIPTSATTNPLLTYFRALPQHNNNRKPSRICWTFGDNKDTCINYVENYTGQYVVSHIYNHPGLYEVCVNILYFGGCEAKKCNHIQVARPDTCHADFERIPTSATTNPLLTYFRALPQHNNNRKPSRICWTFGDNKDTCINYVENYTGQYVVSHTYNHPGLYEVCINIQYFGGCEARKCNTIQVARPDTCHADFERIPVSATTNPLLTYFRALPQHNNDRKPARICWTFGDNKDTCINYVENYTGQYAVSHSYLQPGQYEVCVNILYYGGCEAKKCKPVIILPPQTCTVGLFEIAPSITSLIRSFLVIPSSAPTRRPERICWNFGDGTDTCIIINPQQPLPDFLIRHTYPGPGVYTACVKVWFQGGCIADKCLEVVIRGTTNVCGGYMTDSLVGPRTFKFKGFGIQNPNDEAISYRWTFGDGSSALGREVTHAFSLAGDFEVCLTIRTRLGCETRICKTVRVPGNNQPALHLSPNPVVNVLHAEFFSTHTEQVNIKILNATGTPVRNYVRNATVGPNNWDFDLSSLLPGVYSFIIQSPNQLASAIFIKQ